MTGKPTILKRTTLAATRFFRIESIDLLFSNGARRTFERLVRGSSSGAVLIVPLLDDNTVLMVREYAAGVHRYEIGLPKGKVETGEPLFDAANRELMEEIGYGAGNLLVLSSFTVAPGYLEHATEIVLARELYEERRPGDEPEELQVVQWRLDRLYEHLAAGDCTEARSIAALFLTREFLDNARARSEQAPRARR